MKNHWPSTAQENREREEHDHDTKRTGEQLCERTGTKKGGELKGHWGFNSVVRHCCFI